VERGVWTERRLRRLTSGESADRVWFRLWDKTDAPANLHSAFDKVWSRRRGRGSAGAKDALRRVDTLLKAGHGWVVDADLKSYFDTIPHERLLALVRERVADGRVLALVESFLHAGVMEEAEGWQPTERGWWPCASTPKAASSARCWRTFT